jgi:hypothetical protein
MFPALPQNLGPWLFVFWGLAFLCFWSLVVAMISFVGGWHTLAKTYPAEETTFRIASENTGKQFRWTSLVMGPRYFPTNYGNCVNVVVSDLGIRVAVTPLFRTLHPPIQIPWSAIESCTLGKQMLLFKCATTNVTDVKNPLKFFGKCAEEIDRVWSNRASGDERVASGDDYVDAERR